MIKLDKLVLLQAAFACVAIGYLLLSIWRLQATGTALSAAEPGTSLTAFVVYSLALLLPRYGFLRSYRLAMLVALLLFGGGVIGNILRHLDSGLEHYASFLAFATAEAINA